MGCLCLQFYKDLCAGLYDIILNAEPIDTRTDG